MCATTPSLFSFWAFILLKPWFLVLVYLLSGRGLGLEAQPLPGMALVHGIIISPFLLLPTPFLPPNQKKKFFLVTFLSLTIFFLLGCFPGRFLAVPSGESVSGGFPF